MTMERSRIGNIFHRFIQLQTHWLKEWIDCMWGQMNIVGKIIFLPFMLFGLIAVPILIPPLEFILFVLTWKPNVDKNNNTKNG